MVRPAAAFLQASVQSTYLRKKTMVVLEDGLRTAHHIHELHGSRGGDERRVIERALHNEALLPVIGREPVAQRSVGSAMSEKNQRTRKARMVKCSH